MANLIRLRSRQDPTKTRTFSKPNWDMLLPSDPFKLEWEYDGNVSPGDTILPKSEIHRQLEATSNRAASGDGGYIPEESRRVMERLDEENRKKNSDESLRNHPAQDEESFPGNSNPIGLDSEALRVESVSGEGTDGSAGAAGCEKVRAGRAGGKTGRAAAEKTAAKQTGRKAAKNKTGKK